MPEKLLVLLVDEKFWWPKRKPELRKGIARLCLVILVEIFCATVMSYVAIVAFMAFVVTIAVPNVWAVVAEVL